ncbi:hypothetical protein M9458_052766 [Cirrhinus mrigala]|uniref:SGNH hydrolase-type esterase domain-containing protein n=1 Tax=Cirrhinus mrigala TaxID=683832 RepID=A0ABD0MPB5_CIRMR
MSLSKSATPGSIASRACPAACGALIAAKDSHEFCVVCLGLKHAEQALADPEHCSHCLLLPKKLLRRRLKVAATQCLELGLSDSDGGHGDGDALPGASQGATPLNWAELPNPAFPEEDIFSGNLLFVDEPAGSGDDDDAGLLGVSEDEEAIPLSGVAQVNPPAVVPQSILLEVCERAAARLNIEWPAPQSATDQERDVYDGKVLGPPPGPRKQLFPVLPACAKHMRHYWTDPLDFKHGLTGLEVKDMATPGMGDPPAVEPSIARHLNPAQGGLLAPPKPVLPSKMDRFSASVYQAAYKSSAVAVRALNVSSLLSAYQAENLDDLGQQLDKGSPSPTLWKEILMVNDLVLRNARQAVQASGRAMALSVVGERALWLNLSGLPDSEKRRIAGAPVEPGQALFGPAVAMMQQRCDDKKKEDEAFKLCLPRKTGTSRQLPTARVPNPPVTGRTPLQKHSIRRKTLGKAVFCCSCGRETSQPHPRRLQTQAASLMFTSWGRRARVREPQALWTLYLPRSPRSKDGGSPMEGLATFHSPSVQWLLCVIPPRSGGERTGRIGSPKLLSSLRGVSNESCRCLAVSVSSRMGDSYNNEGLQTSVCHKAPSFQRNSLFSHGRELRSHSERRNRRSSPEGGDSGATVEEIRSGNRRSLRLARKRPVPYVLLATGRGRPPRRGRTGPSMAQCASLRISSAIVNSAHPGQGERTEPHSHSDSTQMAQISMAGTDSSSSVCAAVATPATHGPPVSSERGDLPSPPRQGGSLGLARERANLNTLGLPPRVVATIQNARASSTRSLYNCKWRVFEQWCDERLLISYQCSLTAILSFLQDLIDGGRSFSTIKVYLAAIAACHVGFDGTTVGQHPLIRRFMKGARRSLPVIKRVIPEWDLSMVLEVLSRYPFEPLGDISLKLLSLKTALLLALASTKRVSDLHALSVHSSCMKFSISGDKVLLRPNPAFMPKCFPAFACEVIQLSAFHPPPFSSSEDKRLNALCPVRSLRVYIDRTSAFRRSDQLFISWAPPNTGNPISKQRLSHWLVEAISLAYESKGVRPPEGLRAHSTRAMAASWALFNGVSLQDICAAASWASPHTFVRYYRLDVTQTPVAHSVLGEDTFELHSLQLELEAVEKQIQELLVRQTELRERRAALESSRMSFTPAPGHHGPWVQQQRKTRARPRPRTSPPPPPPVFEISTRNRFAPLRETERDAVIVGDSIVRYVRATLAKGKVHTHCFPGARVLDVSAQIPAILKDGESVGAIVLHAGVNDTRLRQTEVLKRDFSSLIETVRSTSPATRIIVSGPLPTYRRGHERFSRLLALNEWLLTWCKEQKLLFVNNWNLFWERPRLFRADGLHPSRVGAELLSDNISRTLRSI